MKMPEVHKCDVTDCAYNTDHICHTMAITVGGDAAHPKCDTYVHEQSKAGDSASVAGVGACKVSSCEYNQSLECAAKSIDVGWQNDEADCLTFEEK